MDPLQAFFGIFIFLLLVKALQLLIGAFRLASKERKLTEDVQSVTKKILASKESEIMKGKKS